MTTPEEQDRMEEYKKIIEIIEPLRRIMDAKKKLLQAQHLNVEERWMLDRINASLVIVRVELFKLIVQIKDDQKMIATRSYYSLKEFAANNNDESVMKIFEEAKKIFHEMLNDFLKENEN